MPSPFPGMDPYIEAQMWSDFHTRFNVAMSEFVVAAAPERYFVRVEKDAIITESVDDRPDRVAGRDDDESPQSWVQRPDIDVVDWQPEAAATDQPTGGGTMIADAPPSAAVETVQATLRDRMTATDVQRYLTVRTREDEKIVTVIETLSPTNKAGGRENYLARQKRYLHSQASLVELDLLLRGEPTPTVADQTELVGRNDYFAMISAAFERPHVLVCGWRLNAPCPTIPIPLTKSEKPIRVDLQQVIETVWQRSGFDRAIRHDRPLGDEFVPWSKRLATLSKPAVDTTTKQPTST